MASMSNRKWILTATSLGLFVVLMDVSVVNIALRSIQSAFQSDIEGLQWVVNSYTLLFAAFLLTAGSIADRFGAKRSFAGGFAMFTLMSIGCAASSTFNMLVVTRALQGLGAALIVPSSISLLHSNFPDLKERADAIGIWAGAGSLALAAGPVLGGLLIVKFGWRSIFYINVPVGLLGIWLTLRHAPAGLKTLGRGFDLPGQLTAILAIGSMTAAISRAGATSLVERGVLLGFGVALISGFAFILIEKASAHPMVPLSLFRNRSFSVVSMVGLAVNFVFYGMLFLLSLFFQSVQSYSALSAGLAFLPIMVVTMTTNILSGWFISKFGPRRVIIVGLLLAAFGYSALFSLNERSSYLSLLPQLLIAGIGIALSIPSLTVVSLSGTEPQLTGTVSGVFNTARQVGGLLGIAVLGALVSSRPKSEFSVGMRDSVLIAGAVLVSSMLFIAFIIDAKPRPIPFETVEESSIV